MGAKIWGILTDLNAHVHCRDAVRSLLAVRYSEAWEAINLP